MVSGNDQIESFFNSIHVVRESVLPIGLGFRKATQDWGQNSVDLFGQLKGCYVQKKKKKHGGQCVVKVKIKGLLELVSPNSGDGIGMEASKKRVSDNGNGNDFCSDFLQFAVNWSLLVDGFVQAFPRPFKGVKNQVQRIGSEDNTWLCSESKVSSVLKQRASGGQCVEGTRCEGLGRKERKQVSLECFFGFMFDQMNCNLRKFDQVVQESILISSTQFDHWGVVSSILEGRRADVSGFLSNLSFARVGGLPSRIVGVTSSNNEEGYNGVADGRSGEEAGGCSEQNLVSGMLLSNVERLRSTLASVTLTEFGRSSEEYPDKKKLTSAQDFFRYTESEGRRLFEELDRDGDGKVTVEDLESVMRKRKLPRRYARDFMSRARSHLFSKSFGWRQFMSLMEQKEATILRAYTSFCPSESGTLKKSEILTSLKNAGLPANEDSASAMMRLLNADSEGSISYGHFRNFMLLLPNERLQDDPRHIWFEAATVVPAAPPVQLPPGSLLKSALAGGISCAFSCAIMHPVDTIKTQVQASTVLSFPEIIAKLPEIGLQGLYRGSIPAILGQFTSHGLRTGIFEASKVVLINVAPTLPDIQVHSLASFCATVLGTTLRIPSEVLKQRCQAGLFDNAGEALVGTWQQEGLKGFFCGTVFTLFREVPFYVAGMGLYAESKKLAQHILGRELKPWETITVGAISGGLAAVTTTPFDVMKTRMMTAPQGQPLSMQMVAISILRHEGPLGLFKGAVPRFFWVAPLGAMNFAGYELLRKAMDGNVKLVEDQLPDK